MSFGSGKTQQQSTSTPIDMTPPEFQALRGPFAEMLKGLMGTQQNPLAGIPAWGGPFVAPMSGGEQTGLDALGMAATGPMGQARSDLLTKTMSGHFLPGQAGANPFLNASIEAAQRPTLQGLEDTLSRTLPGRFTQAGHFTQPQGSSPFDRAAAVATRGAADAIGDIATKMSFATQEAERGRQQGAVGLSQTEVGTLIANLQAQALPRMIQDLGVQRGMAEFQGRVQTLMQGLAIAAGVTPATVANQQQSTGSGSQMQFGLPMGRK